MTQHCNQRSKFLPYTVTGKFQPYLRSSPIDRGIFWQPWPCSLTLCSWFGTDKPTWVPSGSGNWCYLPLYIFLNITGCSRQHVSPCYHIALQHTYSKGDNKRKVERCELRSNLSLLKFTNGTFEEVRWVTVAEVRYSRTQGIVNTLGHQLSVKLYSNRVVTFLQWRLRSLIKSDHFRRIKLPQSPRSWLSYIAHLQRSHCF